MENIKEFLTTAYIKGQQDFANGIKYEHNPFKIEEEGYFSWQRGWILAKFRNKSRIGLFANVEISVQL